MVVSAAHSNRYRVLAMSNRLPWAGRRGYDSRAKHVLRRSKDMTFSSIDPAGGERWQEYPAWDAARLEEALAAASAAAPAWGARSLAERCALLRCAGEELQKRRDDYALLMSREMGKVMAEARAEIEKSAKACLYYADEAPKMLADEVIPSDAKRSLVAYQPLGLVLAIMPWNFPFWQV